MGSDNLGGEARPDDFARDVALFATPDVEHAVDRLARAAADGGVVLDLGGGNGLCAVLLARRGVRVLVADLSLPRLQAARRLVAALVPDARVEFVCAAAESLPLATGGLAGAFTKSVLIHTDVARSGAELARVLSPEGRAIFIEPTPGNPFAALYRATLAPREWQAITTYFGAREWRALSRAFADRRLRRRSWYVFAFLATALQFIVRWPAASRVAFGLFGLIDGPLLALVPAARRLAWFESLEVGAQMRDRRRRIRTRSSFSVSESR